MKLIKQVFLIGVGLVLLLNRLQAQTTAVADSVVQLTAEAQGLELVSADQVPRSGTFWLVSSNGFTAPLPCPPQDTSLPIYQMADGQFLVDATAGQVVLNAANGTTADALAAQADAVANLINGIQETQGNRAFARAYGLDFPSPGDGGDGDSTNSYFSSFFIDTNRLWLEITNVSGGLADLNLHRGTNQVYAIWVMTNLLTDWRVELELWPTNPVVQAFTLPTLGRDNLFVRAEDWTGVDSNGDGIPDWWVWKYFGSVNLTDTNLDYSGNDHSFGYEYSNNITPSVFKFIGLAITNNYVSFSQPTVQLNVAGTPYYLAALVDNDIFSNAVWNTYASSNVAVNLGLTEGWHEAWIGLRGHVDASTSGVWRYMRLNLDWTPPVITITNPVNASDVAGSYLLVQGMANEALSSLTYGVSNAVAILTNQTGYITGQYLDPDTQVFTTNYFQFQNVPLADGVNTLTIHAVDNAGNQTTTSVSYTRPSAPPVFDVVWPQSGTVIMGDAFNVQGQVGNVSANIRATIVDANGNTNTVQGIVEKDGKVWINQLPLGVGENALTIATTGGTVLTNLTVERSSVTVTLDPFSSDQLNQPSVNVFGTVSDSTLQLTVNGTAATVNEDGTWEADGVPVNLSGTAVLDVEVSSGMTSSFMARNLMRPNDSSSDSASGSQEFTQIQPPVVVIKSYNQHLHEEGYTINTSGRVLPGYSDEVIHWNYYAGGSFDAVQDSPQDGDYGGHSADSQDLPAGDAALGDSSLDWIWPNWSTANVKHYITESTAYYNDFNNQTDTRVMVRHQGQDVVGSTNVYLVRACASEVSDLLVWDRGGDMPLPPEWLQINGQTLVNSGITNENDGSVWGITSVAAASGEDVDVTPVATQWTNPKDYSFDVQVARLFAPAVDNNRDGQINFDASDATTPAKPFRFWLNWPCLDLVDRSHVIV